MKIYIYTDLSDYTYTVYGQSSIKWVGVKLFKSAKPKVLVVVVVVVLLQNNGSVLATRNCSY